ncbi:hypothetical protein LQZ24_04485 [Fructobacillus sp. M1-13]|uniref:Uncharacterized protein n=1 Tax=Fructobacillus papyriferae TaxID=2713171 RepID=A0ABS5QRF8_9LACO|nr:hypothetical protein [Fructobacillus papyriferae]MBS9335512.1 hypothetical protein [Fructobacillus papyriferae]MCD2159282.1 hypothetical protein [Fructobacillus papyriferae]
MFFDFTMLAPIILPAALLLFIIYLIKKPIRRQMSQVQISFWVTLVLFTIALLILLITPKPDGHSYLWFPFFVIFSIFVQAAWNLRREKQGHPQKKRLVKEHPAIAWLCVFLPVYVGVMIFANFIPAKTFDLWWSALLLVLALFAIANLADFIGQQVAKHLDNK